MSRFLDALESGKVLLMDGAMGTELQRAGLPDAECGEAWNLIYPERVRAIHQAYVDAGAECLLTNTFQSNSAALKMAGLGNLAAIYQAGIELARDVAERDRFVLLDVGPLGKSERAAVLDIIRFARRFGADAVLVETCSDVFDLHHMLHARQELGITDAALPVLTSWTFRHVPNGSNETVTGFSPRACAGLGLASSSTFPVLSEIVPRAQGIGVNCGRDIGMDEVIQIIREYRSATDRPLFARPNAGTPTKVDGRWVYPLTPAAMADRLPDLLEAGVTMIGGCCGTTPEHIAAMKPVVDEWNRR
jgi:5-methyltetrahydrofolate--homocysteine methyltransferase